MLGAKRVYSRLGGVGAMRGRCYGGTVGVMGVGVMGVGAKRGRCYEG